METTLIGEICAFLFGRKYYANIIATKGTARMEICSRIFRTKAEAEQHKAEIAGTMSFLHVETISFRSRREY
jgi:hypothetical protein